MEKQSGHKKQSDVPRRAIDKELITDREWQELMGVNRDTYKRSNGAVRRR